MSPILTRVECLERFGSDYFIEQMVQKGTLHKVGRGIYSEEKYVPEVAVLSHRYPNAVVTMRNAFYMHGLTDVIPEQYDFATTRDAAKIPDTRVKQFFVPEPLFSEGIEQMSRSGYPVRIYNKERMLVELLRYKTKLPFDYYKEILLNYRRILPRLSIQRIQDYALMAPKSNKIIDTLQLEVL